MPTTCSRPSTEIGAFMFSMYICMYVPSPQPVPWPERDRLKNTIVLKGVVLAKDVTSVYENFSREYLSKTLSGNVCKNCTLQNIKYERCGYFLIIGKLIIFHDFLRQKEFQNSQWFARYMGLKVPYFLSPSFWYNVFDLKSF